MARVPGADQQECAADQVPQLGHSLRSYSAPDPTFVRCAPNSDQTFAAPRMTLSANRVISQCRKTASLSPLDRREVGHRPPN